MYGTSLATCDLLQVDVRVHTVTKLPGFGGYYAVMGVEVGGEGRRSGMRVCAPDAQQAQQTLVPGEQQCYAQDRIMSLHASTCMQQARLFIVCTRTGLVLTFSNGRAQPIDRDEFPGLDCTVVFGEYDDFLNDVKRNAAYEVATVILPQTPPNTSTIVERQVRGPGSIARNITKCTASMEALLLKRLYQTAAEHCGAAAQRHAQRPGGHHKHPFL